MTQEVKAAKEIKMQGKTYKVGDKVDISTLSQAKVSQLLDQRILRLA